MALINSEKDSEVRWETPVFLIVSQRHQKLTLGPTTDTKIVKTKTSIMQT